MKDRSVYDFDLNNEITMNEVLVPTASYRMGVSNMGYGAAIAGRYDLGYSEHLPAKVLVKLFL